ncbi:NGFI-A-binding protein homolog isoform X2 [Agrilus planipennis]|uniref:NGFI-A-binding protein homolog isoform X2 n=1 Tax=Agrilus planipennis TaxID=224129 RepID=A0A1W4XFE9_AGRPL|nr:NGFI-A-binding protein homolog isoform X2 [Agrilus planipennis]
MDSELATVDDSRSSSACSVVRMSPKTVATTPVPSATPPITTTPLFPQTTASPLSLFYRNSSPSILKKIMSKNHNKTIYPTSYPSNLAELQLFRVMQNASLLFYYDTLLEMGGDDVHQLCDAGEEEFLEIMSLVGMASKPLHVRRLQKSLQEWVSNPNKFKTPLIPGEDFDVEISSPRISSNYGYQSTIEASNQETNKIPYTIPISGESSSLPTTANSSLHIMSKRPYSPLDGPSCPPSSSSSPGASSSSVNIIPTLTELQIAKIAAAAEKISKQLPQVEPKPFSNKKKMCKELDLVMSMSEHDPKRMEEIRRYAAIYGRFDCKRKPEKQLTLHEVSVNEAAAQICRFVPSLLTRRDELFPLARQIVKESGLNYSKTHVSSSISNKFYGEISETQHGMKIGLKHSLSESEQSVDKKIKLDIDGKSDLSNSSYSNTGSAGGFDAANFSKIDNHEACLAQSPIRLFFQHHSKNNNLKDSGGRNVSSTENEDSLENSFVYSNCSSPVQVTDNDNDNTLTGNDSNQTGEDKKDAEIRNDHNKMSPNIQVIAASGDNIIAVANPALVMSTSIIPRKLENLS